MAGFAWRMGLATAGQVAGAEVYLPKGKQNTRLCWMAAVRKQPAMYEMGENVKRQQLLDKFDKAWATFKESYVGLTDEQMLVPGVTGEWSVRDILAHISWWEEEALKYLPHLVRGERLPRYSVLYGGIDAFNAQMTEEKRHLTLSEVLRQLDDTHRRLIAYVESVPEEQYASETPFRHRLRLDTYGHYPIHARAIREWRERSA
jgi:hypothetical protein